MTKRRASGGQRFGIQPRRLVLVDLFLHIWRFRLTPTGRFLVVAGIICGSFGIRSIEMPIYHVFCAMACLGVVAVAAGTLLRARVKVDEYLPQRVSAGNTVEATFKLTNESRRPVYDLAVWLSRLHSSVQVVSSDTVTHLPKGESATVSVTLHPMRRGLYTFPKVRPFSTFPFGIWRTRMKSADKRGSRSNGLLVLPSFHALDDVAVPAGARYQPGGIALTSNVGESPDYIGNRDYRPGDPWRKVDSRSWARLARPVVREYREEYYQRVALVLDTRVPGRWRTPALGFPQLEAAVSLAAAVADGLSRGECIIDLFAAGPKLYVFRTGRSIAHLENVLDILACVEASHADCLEEITPALADELSSISTLIGVFLDWDSARRDMVRTARECGCHVKSLIVRDKPPTLPLEGEEDAVIIDPEAICEGRLGSV